MAAVSRRGLSRPVTAEMDSRSQTAPTSVKKRAILINGASGSGKTRLLQALAGRTDMTGCKLLEADGLEYWARSPQEQARERTRFRAWYQVAVAESGELARELQQNVLDHDAQALPIKWNFLRYALASSRLVVVNPQLMRWTDHAARFYELASLQLDLEVLHVALLPSSLRFAMNLSSRRGMSLSFVREWALIRYRQRRFDFALRYGARGIGAAECDAIARLMTAGVGNSIRVDHNEP